MNGDRAEDRRPGIRMIIGLLVVLAVAGVVLSQCTPANPDAPTYQDRTALTLGAALSDVATVQRVLKNLEDDRIFRTTALAQVRASGDSLDSNAGAFSQVNPPQQLHGLYTRTSSLLSDASDSVTEARLAIERNQVH